MTEISRLMIANRGEVAIRVHRAAKALGIATVAVAPEDDQDSLHVERADASVTLPGRGAAAYLDVAAIVGAAVAEGCDAVHPGYGFLSENAELAEQCGAAGVTFVGPSPESLALLGDKAAARTLAEQCGVPVIEGTSGVTSLDEAAAFMNSLGSGAAVMVKALAGGGGRGMRAVADPADLADAYERCGSEAESAFGNGDLYVERLLKRARHIEVQVLGDGTSVVQLGERECSLQRRNQKVIELSPAIDLPAATREGLFAASLIMAERIGYLSLGTFEFLVDADDPSYFAFIEANARLQVEHTVTEAVTGLDLVRLQLRVAGGTSLADLGLDQGSVPLPTGRAVQVRINTETMDADGGLRPTGGTVDLFEAPSGPGIRTDTAARAGITTHAGFDSLFAKVICHTSSDDANEAYALADSALAEFRIGGVTTNLALMRAVLTHPGLTAGPVTTGFIEDNAVDLFDTASRLEDLTNTNVDGFGSAPREVAGQGPEGTVSIPAPMQGTVISLAVQVGDEVRAGADVAILEAMKMEHVITAPVDGTVRAIEVGPGDTLFEDHPILFVEPGDVTGEAADTAASIDLDYIRPDLAEVIERHDVGLDHRRPEAVERRRRTGHRTVRENVIDLVDEGSWAEYGHLALADQRDRFGLDWLLTNSPADGMVAGIGTVNAGLFGTEDSQTVVMAYDYTVFAGTQGQKNHRKKDRMMDIAERGRLPVVFYAEGGGGRPGADWDASPGFDLATFHAWGKLSGLVPLVGITTGRCFAGNAAILGCCDVIIATEGSNIGMGGPAMIEGGGLGVFKPEDVGPLEVQVPNGVVDIVVADEAEATTVAQKYLSYFQGRVDTWEVHDQRELRHVVPENRLRAYDVRKVIELVCDVDSVLELRPEYGLAMVTALARVEGRPVGVIANNAMHIGGAIDGDASDKASRFMQLCDAFDIPIIMLCDTPGIMVGPEVEKTALVRRASRMFVTGANLAVPVFMLVLRKSYGLGALGMAAGSFRAPIWSVSWPTGEFGGMGLEGFVRLGFRKELEAFEDDDERQEFYERKVAELYDIGKALNVATQFELDDVIDPAQTRFWILRGLQATRDYEVAPEGRRPFVDTW